MHNPIFLKRKKIISFGDLVALIIIILLYSIISKEFQEVTLPVEYMDNHPIDLNKWNLPGYCLRTTMRMFVAIIFSFLFSIIYASLAVKIVRLEKILVALLDILQSIPIFGYLSFTVTWFTQLAPDKIIGMEYAVIFAIFTSQVWNMTFSFYQSLKLLPTDLIDVSDIFRLSKIERFIKLELPYALPGLIYNSMMSMAGGWFFIVASEAISIGNTQFDLPGIGSYIALALKQKNTNALVLASLSLFLIIFVYDQLIFKPLLTWSAKFKYDLSTSNIKMKSWFYKIIIKSSIFRNIISFLKNIYYFIIVFNYKYYKPHSKKLYYLKNSSKLAVVIYYTIGLMLLINASIHITIKYDILEIMEVIRLSIYSLIRVVLIVVIATVIWTPIGIYIGLKPKINFYIQPLLQWIASLPVNLFFPPVVILLVKYNLNSNIWLSILMIVGAQWYILFNIIAASSNFPNDLIEVVKHFKIGKSDYLMKVMLPAILPYLVTGAITATGAAWNASIISEIANWGDITLKANGIGAYIAQATTDGDSHKIALGIFTLTFFVILLNRLVWRPIYKFAANYSKL